MKKYFSTKGYYLVLLLCVAVICISGAYALKNNMNKEPDQLNNNNLQTDASSTETPGGDVEVGANTPVNAPSTSPSGSKTNTPSPSAPSATPGANFKLTKPINGEITQGLAVDKLVYNNTLKEWRTHSGIDIKGNAGDEVKCAYAGTVKDVKNDPRFGPTVIVDNSNGIITSYSGLADLSTVKAGQKLALGETLGVLGDTIFLEKADGIHLHFELKVNSKVLDPSLYFE